MSIVDDSRFELDDELVTHELRPREGSDEEDEEDEEDELDEEEFLRASQSD